VRSSEVVSVQRRTGIVRNSDHLRMATFNDDCHTGSDMDTLTVMNEDVVPDVPSSNDHRQVSKVLWNFSRELTSQSTFGS
jgi:hypothetical protein